MDLDHGWHHAKPIVQPQSNCELSAAGKQGGIARDYDSALVDESAGKGLAVLQEGAGTCIVGLVECGGLPHLGWCDDLWRSLANLSVSLRHGCRAIPIAWTIVEGKGLVQVNKLKIMLEKVQRFMKRYVKRVTLLADAGFRDCDWAQLCQDLGWNYAIRTACNTYITLPDGTSDRLDKLVPINRNRYFQNVLLTRETKLLTNVSVTWTKDSKGKSEMVAIITDQIACRARLREYAGRMSIEQSFRDDKSGGFDLEHTRLHHARRIDHLLLAMAIATLWCHELGEFVLKQGETARCFVDPAHARTLSLFQLGLRWLKRILATGLHFLPDFQARFSNLKLKPVFIPVSLNSNV